MKYILLIGASNAGKSTTVNEVCKRLNPSKIWRLESSKDIMDSFFVESTISSPILNGTYLIEVNGDMILVSAGSPTEQKITITVLVSICIKLEINIKFLIVSMRSFEKRAGYSTKNELHKLGEKIYEEKIAFINEHNFIESNEWNGRVNRIVNVIHQHQEKVNAEQYA